MRRSAIIVSFACWVFMSAIANAEYRIVLIEVKASEGKDSRVSIRSEDKADRANNVDVDAAIKVIDKMKSWGSSVGVYIGVDDRVPHPDRNKILAAIMKNGVLDFRHFGTEIPPDIAARLPAPQPAENPEPGIPAARDTRQASASDVSKFPRLSGKVTHFIGHELGYVRPRVGEPFTLDFNNLANLQRLDFDPEQKSYIPLPEGRFVLDKVHTYTTGSFASCRLTSAGSDHIVNMDIVPKPGRGDPNLVEVWISIERHGLLSGVAVVDCLADGPFPGHNK